MEEEPEERFEAGVEMNAFICTKGGVHWAKLYILKRKGNVKWLSGVAFGGSAMN